MSDNEIDQEGEVSLQDDENAHQVCFVYKPFSIDDLDDEKPAKKRQKTKPSALDEPSLFPLLNDGAEPADFAQSRHDAFRETWARKQSRIEKIVSSADEAAWEDIESFVKAPRNTTSGRLRTGLVVSGPDGGAQIRLFERWKVSEKKQEDRITIQLGASQCTNLQITLKNIIKNTITSQAGQDGYQAFVSQHKPLIPMSFDLELLQTFVERNAVPNIVISVLDVETFDMAVLSDLLLTLSSWSQSIPFTVLLGIATTVELFESRLPKSVIEVLDAKVFHLPSSEDVLNQILDDIQLDTDQNHVFGPTSIAALKEMTQGQGVTIDSFTSAIKYAFMSNFFANSLSVLLGDTESLRADKSLCEAIRNTSSFREHCEDLLDQDKPDAKAVTQLLDDDRHLFELSRQSIQITLSPSEPQDSIGTSFPSEAYLIDSRQFCQAFTPRPRYVLERALSRPGDYLGCECCQSTSATSSAQAPPTAILYTLLQEAGTVINMRDLYDAFCARCFPDSDHAADETVDVTEKADRAKMSVLYSCLAELKMLGLVKSSTSTLVKKRAMASSGLEVNTAARGKERYGDVDFIAKTGWAGL